MIESLKEFVLDVLIVAFIFITTAGTNCQPRSCHDVNQRPAANRAP